MLKRFCAMGLVLAFLSVSSGLLLADEKAGAGAEAVDPARLAAARKLLDITGSSQQFDTVMPQVLAQLQPYLEKKAPGHRKVISEVMNDLAEKFAPRRDELLNKVAALYAKTLSAEELDQIVTFFSAGAGKAYVESMPSLVQGSVGIGKQWGQTIGQEMKEKAEAELKKRGVPIK